MDNIRLLYIDLFCGAGGTSTGCENAVIDGKKIAKVIACVNHDANAIASHKANHPDAIHYTEDIRTLDLGPMQKHVEMARRTYPDALVVLWASLECTNFSRAKGGMSRDADSRTLAEHLYRYVEAIRPDVIQIENVEEFITAGPLIEKRDKDGNVVMVKKSEGSGKDKHTWMEPAMLPDPDHAGEDFHKWVHKMCSYGYRFKYRVLNSADYGAYTSRKRFFGMFAKPDVPIVFPVPTHSRNPEKTLFGGPLKPWKPVREVLDLNDEGVSIFGRKKDLVDATLRRILAGLYKFVAGGETAFLTKAFSGDPERKCSSIAKPAGAVTAKDHHQFITANRKWHYIVNPQFTCPGNSIEEPCPTVIARQDKKPLSLAEVKTAGRLPAFIKKDGDGLVYEIYDTDSDTMKQIKLFMCSYGIVDITMRMLRIKELKLIQGFPEDYILCGTQEEQKKYLGNAVVTIMAKVWCEAIVNEYHKNPKLTAS